MESEVFARTEDGLSDLFRHLSVNEHKEKISHAIGRETHGLNDDPSFSAKHDNNSISSNGFQCTCGYICDTRVTDCCEIKVCMRVKSTEDEHQLQLATVTFYLRSRTIYHDTLRNIFRLKNLSLA